MPDHAKTYVFIGEGAFALTGIVLRLAFRSAESSAGNKAIGQRARLTSDSGNPNLSEAQVTVGDGYEPRRRPTSGSRRQRRIARGGQERGIWRVDGGRVLRRAHTRKGCARTLHHRRGVAGAVNRAA